MRRQICLRNLNLCFPTLTSTAIDDLARRTFRSHAFGIFETAWAWYSPKSINSKNVHYENLEIVEDILGSGSGVLLLGAHYTMLDLILVLVHRALGRITVSYRPHNNGLIDQEVKQQRSQFADLVNVRNMRSLVRRLKEGGIAWFAFDQDLGIERSVLSKFFDIPVATVRTPEWLCRMSGCCPVFVSVARARDQYTVTFNALPSWFPCESSEINANTLNRMVESAVAKHPEQYMWLHKRFKSQPGGHNYYSEK